MTLAELETLENATGQRYELWHGGPIAMTGGTLTHNLIALGLYRAIYPQLKPGCRVVVADVKLHLSEAADSDAAYPDVIALLPEQRGQGLGMRLLNVLLAHAQARCAGELFALDVFQHGSLRGNVNCSIIDILSSFNGSLKLLFFDQHA
jgi:GNAT superfamily N-acetyltransferase